MHYRCAIIMPPTNNIKAAIDKIMAPFDITTTHGEKSHVPFYDYYEIGGRWEDPKTPNIIQFEELTGLEHCFRCMITDKHHDLQFMIEEELWNGVTFVKTEWDSYITTALDLMRQKFQNYNPEFQQSLTPQPDWLVVTIDYHS